MRQIEDGSLAVGADSTLCVLLQAAVPFSNGVCSTAG
jgi:hypothetical protein